MIKDAQTKLGGQEKKKKKTKGSKIIELLIKIIDMMMIDQVKKEKKINEEPKPNTKGHDKPF
jgi:hypothetical protein